MRSLLAFGAAAWFAFLALTFLPWGGAFPNPGAPGGIDGDPATVAIVHMARDMFVGLAVVSLALVEWRRIGAWASGLWNSTEPRLDGAKR